VNVVSKIGIGSSISRVDGVAKVTGAARYSAEYAAKGLLYGVIVSSAIAKGKIISIDETGARKVAGVAEVLTHLNRPHIAWFDSKYQDLVAPPGSPFRALYSEEIQFSAQPVALVLAETFEAARYAASLVEISYKAELHNVDFQKSLDEKFLPSKPRNTYQPAKNRGDAEAAFAAAPLKIDVQYHLPPEHHNPVEPHASTVIWEKDGKIIVYDKTQGSQNIQSYISNVFGMSKKDVRVVNSFVGGGFGSGLRPQYQVYLAVMAAKFLKRSVKVVLTRQQMFTHVHRPEAVHNIKLGAATEGKLTAIINDATTSTSRFENNMENIVTWGMMNYACPNASGSYTIAPRDTYTSGDMRAPGAATGMTFFEMAIDEMAYQAKMDPVEFRLLNYSEVDAMKEAPFTSKALREAFKKGAEAFGWSKRSAEPCSMKEGKELVGWGVATGMWDAMFSKTTARAKLSSNGHLEIATATSDIGTGTYTVMAQVAADTLGLPLEMITARLGDSDLPACAVEGGSWAAASAGAAVQMVCKAIGEKLLKAAVSVSSNPLGDASLDEVIFVDGNIVLKIDPSKRVAFSDVMRLANLPSIEVEETATAKADSDVKKARNTHSAIFAEVKVDEELNLVRVTRIVNAVAAGRIINPKTARSQILGGVVMGIGMALHEETFLDNKLGRFINHSLAEYHVPVNADIDNIEVIFVDEPDAEVTPLGVKGLGEIGIVGTAAAVANAIYHATGKRVRNLPITIDKLLEENSA
jgi:xanthine dehydrogenase YagR molybdenum-binding subunit